MYSYMMGTLARNRVYGPMCICTMCTMRTGTYVPSKISRAAFELAFSTSKSSDTPAATIMPSVH